MSIGRALAFLPCLVLLAVAGSWLGPRRSDSSRFDAAFAEDASACGGDDCGCPHDASPADCCCKANEEPVPDSRVGGSVPAAPDIDAAGAERPTASMAAAMTSFFCGGGKRSGGSAHSSGSHAALAVARSGVAPSARPTWTARRESAPPPELAREPATPPPRGARA